MPRYSHFDSFMQLDKNKCVITHFTGSAKPSIVIEYIDPKTDKHAASVITNFPPVVTNLKLNEHLQKWEILKRVSKLNADNGKEIFTASSWSISPQQKKKCLDRAVNKQSPLNEQTWDFDLLKSIGISATPYDADPEFFPIPEFITKPKQLAVSLFTAGTSAAIAAMFAFSSLSIFGLAVGVFALTNMAYQHYERHAVQPKLKTKADKPKDKPAATKTYTPSRHHMKTRSGYKIENRQTKQGETVKKRGALKI